MNTAAYPKIVSIAMIALLMRIPQFVHADPYFTVDDPGTPEAQHWEIDLVTLTSQSLGQEQENPLVDATYGYSNNFAFDVTTGIQSNRSSGEGRVTGAGDSTFEEIWRFQEETPNIPQISIHNATKIPTAPSNNGLGTGKYDDSLDVALGKSFGNAGLYGDIGYTWLGADFQTNNTFWGVKLNYQATGKIVAGMDLYGNTPAAPGEHQEIAFDVGMSYDVSADRSLLLTVGKSTEGFSDLNVAVGIELDLGPETPSTPDADSAAFQASSPPGIAFAHRLPCRPQ